MDDLWGLNSNDHYTVELDDMAVRINGNFFHSASEVLETALCTVQQWCERTKFSINPIKVLVIPFTRQRNVNGAKEPILLKNDPDIQWSQVLANNIRKGIDMKKAREQGY
jgi:hypothetical protein